MLCRQVINYVLRKNAIVVYGPKSGFADACDLWVSSLFIRTGSVGLWFKV